LSRLRLLGSDAASFACISRFRGITGLDGEISQRRSPSARSPGPSRFRTGSSPAEICQSFAYTTRGETRMALRGFRGLCSSRGEVTREAIYGSRFGGLCERRVRTPETGAYKPGVRSAGEEPAYEATSRSERSPPERDPRGAGRLRGSPLPGSCPGDRTRSHLC